MHYVYILRCADGSFYVGSAQDLNDRVKAHNDGRGAAHTYKHRPVRLVYSEAFDSETAAVRRERQIKRWSHDKKQALVDGNIERLAHLSKRRR
jgi:putative endonuclease